MPFIFDCDGPRRSAPTQHRENLLITRPAWSQMKTSLGILCSTSISVSRTHHTFSKKGDGGANTPRTHLRLRRRPRRSDTKRVPILTFEAMNFTVPHDLYWQYESFRVVNVRASILWIETLVLSSGCADMPFVFACDAEDAVPGDLIERE